MGDFLITVVLAFVLCLIWVGGYLVDFIVWIVSKIIPDSANENKVGVVIGVVVFIIGFGIAASGGFAKETASYPGGLVAGIGVYTAVLLPIKVRKKREKKAAKAEVRTDSPAIMVSNVGEPPSPIIEGIALPKTNDGSEPGTENFTTPPIVDNVPLQGVVNNFELHPPVSIVAQQGKTEYCVKCGAPLIPGANFCDSCGNDRRRITVSNEASPIPPAEVNREPELNQSPPSFENNIVEVGLKQQNNNSPQQKGIQRFIGNKKRLIAIAGALTVILIAVVVIMILPKSSTDAGTDLPTIPVSDKFEKLTVTAIGETVTFGEWRGESLEWEVLDIQDGKALIITKDIVAVRQYDGLDEYGDSTDDDFDWDNAKVTWADSDIRMWLNKEFISTAFSKSEISSILLSDIKTFGNEANGIDGGNDTTDRVFLLSIDEVNKYFNTDDNRTANFTWTEEDKAYVSKDMATYYESDLEKLEMGLDNYIKEGSQAWPWWLRSPGVSSNYAAYVREYGVVINVGDYVLNKRYGIRPAMWVSANTDNILPKQETHTNTNFVNNVGETVTFGKWREEPLEWEVLDIQDGKALLVTKDIVADRQYDGLDEYGDTKVEAFDFSNVNVSWENSEIRTWLNNEFMYDVFSSREMDTILMSEINTANNVEYGTYGGGKTEDKVFLLSEVEAKQYFGDDKKRIANFKWTEEDKAYVLKSYKDDWGDDPAQVSGKEEWLNGAIQAGLQPEYWWLRTPGTDGNHVSLVATDGTISPNGSIQGTCGIRPAIWVTIADKGTSSSTKKSEADWDAVSRGDFTTVAGSYTSENGVKIIMYSDGSNEGGGSIEIPESKQPEIGTYGEYILYFGEGAGRYTGSFYPKGVEIYLDGKDAPIDSDTTRIRMSFHMPSFPPVIYYKD